VLGVNGARELESIGQAESGPGVLMRRAARAVTRLALARWPHARSIWVAAGPGGNGGDGMHAAAELAQAGRHVQLRLLADPGRLTGDAAQGLQSALEAGVKVSAHGPGHAVDLCLDALLGLGAARAAEGPMAHAIALMNQSAAPVLSVDLPSGLLADSGQRTGPSAVKADATLCLLTLKPGLWMGEGRDLAGELWFDDLGIAPPPPAHWAARLSCPADAHWSVANDPGLLRHDSHKGRFGDVVVIGGARGMAGAARLAAHAALAAGAGRTFICPLDPDAATVDASRPEWLWTREAWAWNDERLAACTVVCGCGGGQAVGTPLPRLLAYAGGLVLDADALNAIARQPELQSTLLARADRGQATVLTPHPLEAARLSQRSVADIQARRLAAASELAARFQCVVVLKGSGTVTAWPEGVSILNSTGNAALAHGGSGDVLAGWIGGAWAARRGRPIKDAQDGRATSDTWLAAQVSAATAWLHGRAADCWPMQAGRGLNLVEAMRDVTR
jgi:hydroxyethylthiazole kinase-like uncharacterized protein yjeF